MGELNKMETKPMLPLIVTMSVPPLISMFLQYTYNFVDCMFVSWISEDALTAVSLAFPITTLMIAMSIGTGVGVNVLIARYLGQKNQDMANSVVSNGIILSAACGVIVTIVVLLGLLKPSFASFTEDPAIYDMAVGYMRICAFMEVSSYAVHIRNPESFTGNGGHDCTDVVSDRWCSAEFCSGSPFSFLVCGSSRKWESKELRYLLCADIHSR